MKIFERTYFLGTVVNLTNPSSSYATDPITAFTPSNDVSTKGASVWFANDLTTGNDLIQGTVLTSSGWNLNAVTFSLNNGLESPNHDYQVSISSYGQKIVVTWSSRFQLNTVLRTAISTDGGATWTLPNYFLR